MTQLKKGDKAPSYAGVNQANKKISLAQFKGKKVILYFYPADMTPTCTIQACNLRDNYSALLKAGYSLIGVSPDSPEKHVKFIERHQLPFDLIADEDHSIATAYGVWGKKKMFGKEYDGIKRTTFIIDEKGKIESIIDKVTSKSHSDQILNKN
ncbi:MAG TPA: thioredoxin-dependent thiol peroxidase [Saprospiraceae bacterium]|nr:thioredoxin-dependent thiol peroxidase [Saprospiraceae bacterium]HQW55963.1 thioredoxin-dependent thiol peroxidase [Saprospiraceae bacterium]